MRYVKNNWTAMLAIFSVALGMIGYLIAHKVFFAADSWVLFLLLSDALFFAIKLFGGGGTEQIADQSELDRVAALCLNIARFTAPLSLVSAFLSRFDNLWKPFVTRSVMSRIKNADLLWGDSSVSSRFHAQNLAEKHWTFSVFPKLSGDTVDYRLSLKLRQIAVSEAVFLRDFSERPLRVRSALLLHTDDLHNIALANHPVFIAIETENRFVHISDESLRLDLVASGGVCAQDGNRVQIISEHELEARAYFHRHDFFVDELARGRDRIHLVFIGLGQDARALLFHFLKVSPHPDLAWPKITIFCEDPVGIRGFIDTRLPAQFSLADISAHPFSNEGSAAHILDELSKHAAPSIVYLSERSDSAQRRLAFELSAAADRLASPAASILLKGTPENRSWIKSLERFEAWPVNVVTPDDRHLSVSFLTGPFDSLARRLHEAYTTYKVVPYSGSASDSLRNWRLLDENLKAANRRAADCAKTKLEAIGIVGEVPITSIMIPEISSERLEAMAEAEHRSWMADRIINGWRPAIKRDNKRRLHNNLVSYHELTEADKELDRQQVRTVMENLKNQNSGRD